MGWSEERVALLRQLWGTGKTASEIADLLGGVSRNAVIGKAHRLELTGRPSPIKRKDEPDEPTEEEVATERPTGGATILNLTERMCKWPIGDPRDRDFHFCGKGTHGSLPYCAEHAAVAYQPAGKRRDDEKSILRA